MKDFNKLSPVMQSYQIMEAFDHVRVGMLTSTSWLKALNEMLQQCSSVKFTDKDLDEKYEQLLKVCDEFTEQLVLHDPIAQLARKKITTTTQNT